MLLGDRNKKYYAVKTVCVFTFTCSCLHNLKNMTVRKCMFQVSDVDFC